MMSDKTKLEKLKGFCKEAVESLDLLAQTPDYQTTVRKAFLEGSKASLDGIVKEIGILEKE